MCIAAASSAGLGLGSRDCWISHGIPRQFHTAQHIMALHFRPLFCKHSQRDDSNAGALRGFGMANGFATLSWITEPVSIK